MNETNNGPPALPFWAVAQARSSNENFGPDYVVFEVDEKLIDIIRAARGFMDGFYKVTRCGGHLRWFYGRVEFFDAEPDPDSDSVWDKLASLVDSTPGGVVVVPAEFDMLTLLQEDREGKLGDNYRSELEGIVIGSPEYGDTAIRPIAEIKHADVEVWTDESIAGLLAGLGIAIDNPAPEGPRLPEVHVLYGTDEWHTNESRFLHGVFSSKELAVEWLEKHLEQQGEPALSDDDKRLIELCDQTQKYEGEGQFMIVRETVNPRV